MADLNEVMNGLDLCEGHGSNCTLEECPYYATRLCVQDLHADTLALLKSQQAEIERLKAKLDSFYTCKTCVFYNGCDSVNDIGCTDYVPKDDDGDG